MDRWVIRKVDVKETSDINQETEEVDNNVVTTPCQSDMKRSVVEPSSSGQQQPKRRNCQEDFIQYGFVCHVVNDVHHPQCVICLEVLANESLKPAKMKRHLQCKHQSFTNKPIDFFRRKKMELQGLKQVITKNVALPVKAQMASYEVAYLIAQRKKPHTTGEELTKPAALAIIVHREALACKAIVPELKTIFDTAVKIVNYIISRPLKARLLASLCKDMGSDHEALLLHTEIRWLSRGKVFTRLYQLRDEVLLFLLESGSEFSVFMTDSNWLGKLVYLSCIFDKLNELNLSIQGPNTNILSLFDKINAFSKKLERWISRAEEGNIEMFPELEEFGEENELCLDNLKAIIVNHLQNIFNHFKKYFLEEADLE
ncbi:zinc finger BED domain-containing protein 5-like [Macrobrachium nipponense]|uniref:zinc finger BED domain-containing protein 5-like n=1 Tax=Macrobrachium nipponense TaxID=159736 RepID=UPI0030C86917